MAYTPIPGDIMEFQVVSFDPNGPTQVGINRITFRVDSVFGGGVDQLAMAQQYDVLIQAQMKAVLAGNVNYRGVLCQKIYPNPRTPASKTAANAGAGTSGADMAPTQTAGLIKLLTDKAGKAFRGRNYFPFIASGDISTIGNASAGYVTHLNTLAGVLYATFQPTVAGNFSTLRPVIFHRKPFGKPPAGQFTFDYITSSQASPLLATQRRRGNYGQANPSSPV